MKIDLIDYGNLEGKITVIVEKTDYEEKYKEELSKLKSKVSLKGFRKGKIPTTALKKMYGKSVLADVVNNSLQVGISDYIQKEKLELLGNPLPSEDQEEIDFDAFTLTDFTFSFDIGLTPQFEVKGASNSDEYNDYQIIVDEKTVDEELAMLRKRQGVSEEVDDAILENDLVSLDAKELKTEDPVHSEFQILVKDIADEDLKTSILKLKVGDTFDFDITKIDINNSEKHIRKYLLKLEDDDDRVIGNMYTSTITKVSRLNEAEMDEDFFTKVFGPDKVKNVDEAKNEIRTSLSVYYKNQGQQLTYREIMENLMDSNDVELPADFLKRWLIAMNEQISSENIEAEYPGFEKNLKWSIIKSNLIKKYEIKVEYQEVEDKFKQRVEGYLQQSGGLGMDIGPLVNRLMSNREDVEKTYEEIGVSKMYDTICTIATLTEKKVSEDEFKETVKKINQAIS